MRKDGKGMLLSGYILLDYANILIRKYIHMGQNNFVKPFSVHPDDMGLVSIHNSVYRCVAFVKNEELRKGTAIRKPKALGRY